MKLSGELIGAFQALLFEKNGLLISYDAAEAQLKDLAELVRLTSELEDNDGAL